MTQTLTVDADGEEITGDDITGLMSLLTRLHEADSLEGLRVEIDADAGVMAGFAGGDVSIEPVGESAESTDPSEASVDAQPDEQESDEQADAEAEGGEESPTEPVVSSFDDPEEAGAAWREYHEETGEVPPLNPDAKYFAPLRILSDADGRLTTSDVVEATEGTDNEMTTSQASSTLYTLVQKGVVDRERPNGAYEYFLTDLGEAAIDAAGE